MSQAPTVIVCLTTVSNPDEARKIAKQLLSDRLAACVQIEGPIESFYHWNGEDHCDPEYRLVIKSSSGRMVALRERIREIHPYDQPQIITLESVDVDRGYANWVEEQSNDAGG